MLRALVLLTLACGAAAFNVGTPMRSTKPALRVAAVPVMEDVVVEEVVEEDDEEEAMSEEEYLAELETEAQRIEDAKAGDAVASQGADEEENLLAPGEAERIKAEIKKRAPWMDIDPEVRPRS